MKITIGSDTKVMAKRAAQEAAQIINCAIAKKGYARIVLSTGASQFDTIQALTETDVDFSKVTMFHLDEYVGLPITHPASFRKYLSERFVSKVTLQAAYFVDGTDENLAQLTAEIRRDDIDLGLIGIGENAHIAFNDPPADFDTKEAYILVKLDDACKRQQVGEGWFPTLDDVPTHAVSMTCHQIMACKKIISCVPYTAKVAAVRNTLLSKSTTRDVPATLLKTHPCWSLYLDTDSAAEICPDCVSEANPNLDQIIYAYK